MPPPVVIEEVGTGTTMFRLTTRRYGRGARTRISPPECRLCGHTILGCQCIQTGRREAANEETFLAALHAAIGRATS